MNQKDSKQKAREPERKRRTMHPMPSLSKQATEKKAVATDLSMPERPLHDYVTEVSERSNVRVGVPLPLGTQESGGGVYFAIFSRYADRVRLELFDHPGDAAPARIIDLDSTSNRTGDIWHVWVEGIGPGQLYAYRVDGPYEPNEGHRFNFNKLLVDPFAAGISHQRVDTIRRPRSETWLFRNWIMPGRCRNVYLSTSPLNGMESSHPGIHGRKPSFTKRMFAALPFIPRRAWTIRGPTEA